uniref:ARAD1C38918p n=1 Tax=Blastobotrys adeninivorans TaxID=409370 RepID=A0A060T8R7_BLAAD
MLRFWRSRVPVEAGRFTVSRTICRPYFISNNYRLIDPFRCTPPERLQLPEEPAPRHGALITLYSGDSQHTKEYDTKRQERLANLGDIVQDIEANVPKLLHSSFPRELLADGIVLKILPDTHPTIPEFVGKVPCNTVIKILQLTVSNLLLPPHSELMIMSSRLDPPYLVPDNSPPKLVIHWRTCSAYDSPTGDPPSFPSSFSYRSINFAPSQLARALQLLPHEYPILTGIFEFEFNDRCDSVKVITITDLEYLSRPAETAAC